jgi:hypothetical protein
MESEGGKNGFGGMVSQGMGPAIAFAGLGCVRTIFFAFTLVTNILGFAILTMGNGGFECEVLAPEDGKLFVLKKVVLTPVGMRMAKENASRFCQITFKSSFSFFFRICTAAPGPAGSLSPGPGHRGRARSAEGELAGGARLSPWIRHHSAVDWTYAGFSGPRAAMQRRKKSAMHW